MNQGDKSKIQMITSHMTEQEIIQDIQRKSKILQLEAELKETS